MELATIRYLGAFLCLFIVNVAWVVEAEIVEHLQTKAHPYNKPAFLCYVTHSMYTVSLLLWIPAACYIEHINGKGFRLPSLRDTSWRSLRLQLYFFTALAIITFFSVWFWYMSLSLTSVSGNTAVFQSSCAIVFVASVLLVGEKATWAKGLAVLACVGGVVVTSLFSSTSKDESLKDVTPKESLLGYAGDLASMIIYAFFQVVFRVYEMNVADEEDMVDGEEPPVYGLTRALFFLGFMGLMTMTVCPLFLVLFNYTGLEVFAWPVGTDWDTVWLNASIDLVINLAVLIGIALSSPLFMSVGQLLSIPVSVLADFLEHGYLMPWRAFVGVGLIIVGFIILNGAQYMEAKEEKRNTLQIDNSIQIIDYPFKEHADECKPIMSSYFSN